MIRKTNPLDIYLLRHAEAYKNLAKVHGGGDQRLTPTGINQARTLSHYLIGLHGSSESLNIIHQPEGRSRETAFHIGQMVAKESVEVPDLVGVQLGVAGGLSEKELAERYPEVATALVAWRTNKGDLSARPRIPGSEPMEKFAERISRGLLSSIDACEPGQALTVVGTTSTLNMMNHLLVHDGDFNRANYDFVEFPLGALAAWRVSSDAPVQTMPITVPTT